VAIPDCRKHQEIYDAHRVVESPTSGA